MILSRVMGAMMARMASQTAASFLIGDNMVTVVILQSWCCTQFDKNN
jgi:hypothetical protein